MIFQYGLEPVLIQRIFIGFKAILEIIFYCFSPWKLYQLTSSTDRKLILRKHCQFFFAEIMRNKQYVTITDIVSVI